MAFVTYTRNELPAALQNLELLQPVVDESLVVDSSTPDHFLRWGPEVERHGARLVRLLPLCDPELMRPFAHSHLRSDRVFSLDADEEPSEAIRTALPELTEADAYLVPRFEQELRMYTWQLRLCRPTALRFVGPSYAGPHVEGTMTQLPEALRIVHRADYTNYLTTKSDRNFALESFQRPFDRAFLGEATSVHLRGGLNFGVPGLRTLARPAEMELGNPAVAATLAGKFVADLLTGGGWRWARFQWRYERAMWARFRALPAHERLRRLRIAAEIRHSGGLIAYLGLTETERLSRLTGSVDWSLSGPELLASMIGFRFQSGRPPDAADKYLNHRTRAG